MSRLLDSNPLRVALASGLPWYGRAATALAAGLGCWLLAGLLWGFSLSHPAPQTYLLEQAQDAVRQLAAQPLFDGSAPAGPVATTLRSHDLHLLGVLHSERGRHALAIVRQDGAPRPLIVGLGEEVAHGLRLSRIEARQITLSGAGQEVRLTLPQPASATPPEPETERER